MKIPVGIDPTETWEVDLCAEAGRGQEALWGRVVERTNAELAGATDADRAGIEARLRTAQASLKAAQDDLAGYVPGAGPRFRIGHIPAPKRAEIAGMMRDAASGANAAEQATRAHAWRREVVRWAVRGHGNLKNARGAEVPFEGTAVTIAGETFQQPTEKQIERYTPFLADLASVALEPQTLGDDAKNG